MKKYSFGLCLSVFAAAQLIAGAARAQTPPPASETPPPAQPPPPPPGYVYPPPPGASGGPVLSLFADNPRARLQMQLGTLSWSDVCTSPCGHPVDPQAIYRVGGGSIQPSATFRLPRPDGQVMVRAHTGSRVKRWVGFGIAMGGLGAAAVGGLYLAAASSASSTDKVGNTNAKDFYKSVGVAELVIGVVLMAVGFPMFASQNTSVEVR